MQYKIKKEEENQSKSITKNLLGQVEWREVPTQHKSKKTPHRESSVDCRAVGNGE